MTTTLPVLRRSAIQTAKSCLYRYDQIWRQGVPDESDYAAVGIGFHAAAHAYILRLLAAQLPSDHEEAKLAFPEGIAKVHTPARLVPETRNVYRWWAEKFQLDLPNFLAAEERQAGQNDQSFTPDVVYGSTRELEVLDFKSYRVPLTEAQLRQDFQARWYVFNAMRIWPNFPVYRFTHSYVRLGTVTSIEFQPHEFETFADEVGAVAASIQAAEDTQQWPATPGPECSYCELQCPVIDRPVLLPKRFLDQATAIKAAELVLAGDKMLKVVKKSLKEYVAAHGPIDVAGAVFDNRPSLSRAYPVDLVVKVLSDRGIAGAFEGLTVSHSALAKLFKRFPALEADLAAAAQTKTIYRFSARKPGIEDEEE